VIEAAGRLVIPGMVDTHRHVWQGAIGGYTPQITGAGYGPVVLTGIALKHSPEDVYAGTLWGALQALDAGITTIADWAHNDQSPAHADADLRGLRDSGIRGYFLYGGPGPATGDPNPPHPADARRMRDEYFASGAYGRLRMGMALRGPCFTSAERNAEDYAFARDLGLASGKQVPAVDLHQRDMLRLATIGGARVWRLEDQIGTLTPGKQADIAVIDMQSPHLDGFGDPVAVMVLGAGPADVETVIVGGDVIKRDGKLAGDNAGHALELMHAAREHLRA
jgi:cytosine/adenosine deaminase-related metal-dependent hydrolase